MELTTQLRAQLLKFITLPLNELSDARRKSEKESLESTEGPSEEENSGIRHRAAQLLRDHPKAFFREHNK